MKVIDFIFAARPMLLMPVWSIYLLAFRLRYPFQAWEDANTLALVGLTLAAAGAYYINQIFDYESDRINNKIGFLQHEIISRNQMIAAFLSVSLVAVIITLFSSIFAAFIVLLINLLGLAYSAPPLKLKDRPLGGLLTNAGGFGVLVPLVAMSDLDADIHLVYIIIYFSLIVAAGYLLTIIPDRKGDTVTGKTTLAAELSNRRIISIGLIMLICSLLVAFLIFDFYIIIVSTVSITLFIIALMAPEENVILVACKLPILLVVIVAGIHYPAFLVFILVLIVLTRLYYRKRFGLIYPRIN
ncbi:MAG: UbiA family prenyltransferase [Candidatus Zixiibacteriota bacterium]